MKKFFAILLFFVVFVSPVLGEKNSSWNLDERIHPDLKEDFSKIVPLKITYENIYEIQKSL